MADKISMYSATMLQDYIDCKRRFEYKYILQQSWPAVVSEPLEEYIQHTRKGKEFHSLVHQYFAGLPLEVIRQMAGDAEVMGWFENFLQFVSKYNFRISHSEFRMQSKIADYNLSAVFDLLALTSENSLIIFDWKTSTVKPRQSRLRSRIQTALYPYILWEQRNEIINNSDNAEKEIKMIYWFAAFPHEPIEFLYDAQTHMDTQNYLTAVLDNIANDIQQGDFPKTDNTKLCTYCQYRSLCERGVHAGNLLIEQELDADDLTVLIDFDNISMIEPDVNR